ncbi:MAG: hypothetical protein GXY85_10805 [Candidatus Brocadiaceae bacterium]|nr:hypothetical protein [Candidatus Brocadiaceae bacterium]
MRARTLSGLLKAGDRVAVSNITGREAGAVTVASQRYCGNIVGGWALGKDGQAIEVPGGEPIPVFGTVEELMAGLPAEKLPNKVIAYSPPPAVYGEVKEVVQFGAGRIETIFIITEHVSVEVTAKIARLCADAGIDVVGCNTLGMINAHDAVRIGAVGGDMPAESFRPGSATIMSNSGNMVNTMASYLQSAGIGTSYGISTGKDVLILTPLRALLELARDDERTRIIVLYVEPGGLYEQEAVEMLRAGDYPKPIVAYVTGDVLGTRQLSLGHAGAVVEGGGTTAAAKMKLFDDYFGIEPFHPDRTDRNAPELAAALARGIRIQALHHLPAAADTILTRLGIPRDFRPGRPLRLNPWFVNLKPLARMLPAGLLRHPGTIPEPYAAQVARAGATSLGGQPTRRSMRNTSHASASDAAVTRIYDRTVEEEMRRGSLARTLLLAWTGQQPEHDFEVELLERCLIASVTNGPGTISAQGAKLSTSAGNTPNTAMIATLACIGQVHGGNGRRGVEYLLRVLADTQLEDPYDPHHGIDLQKLADDEVARFARVRAAAKEAGVEYERIPCLGHPIFRDKPVNYDPRERVIAEYLEAHGLYNFFLDFYGRLPALVKQAGISRNVWALNLDGAIACVVLAICWPALRDRRMTVRRACDLAFLVFALGRAAGGAAEFLDHQDFGTEMDMRVPVSECIALTRPAPQAD